MEDVTITRKRTLSDTSSDIGEDSGIKLIESKQARTENCRESIDMEVDRREIVVKKVYCRGDSKKT